MTNTTNNETVKFIEMDYSDATSFYYDSNDEQREKIMQEIKMEIEKNPLLTKMQNIAKRNVKNYITDFYIHDVHEVSNKSDEKIIWLVRESGTHIVSMSNDYMLDGTVWIADNRIEALKKQRGIKFYLIENGTVKKINEEKLSEVLNKYRPKK